MSRMNVILGTMTFGTAEGSRVTDKAAIDNIIQTFASYGYKDLDTARLYCQGTTEEVLAELGAPDKFNIATKVYPTQPGDHEPEKLKATFKKSLEALKVDSVDLFYLHAPDHKTSFEQTLGAVQELYENGHFKRLGISNFAAWQVSAVCEIAAKNNWIRPTVYQGMYNAITRDVEHELFTCLKHYGIKFYAYNPLAGGLLSPKYSSMAQSVESGSRFDPNANTGKMYRDRYWNQTYFSAINAVHEAAKQHDINTADLALRWMVHHSKLNAEGGDSVIIGASSIEQLIQNLEAFKQGPLPEPILDALDAAWEKAIVKCPPYFR
ncbi:Aldo/keto reductase [Syncephalastrum racemosum]|uniref:Aldo/keto reductase n=1 Tax=Syncephalastrum racemosum TaxID=13706 RepID=A0A1X2H830_SYNRA|nr:Aldo/keto reductase [Syncephalastrum racemosum]